MARDHSTHPKAENLYYLTFYRTSSQTSVVVVPFRCERLSECFAPLVFTWKQRSTLFTLHTSGCGVRTEVSSFGVFCRGFCSLPDAVEDSRRGFPPVAWGRSPSDVGYRDQR